MQDYDKPTTNDNYSPHDLLPVPVPKTVNPPYGQFYHQVAKHLVKDFIRIMYNGIHIDLNNVKELEKVLVDVLEDVRQRLENNPLIKQFQLIQHKHLVKEYKEEKRSKMRSYKHYLKEFDYSNIEHRSYFMHQLLLDTTSGLSPPYLPTDKLVTGILKWKMNDCKKLISYHPAIRLLVEKKIKPTNLYAKKAMLHLAKDKAEKYNQSYKQAIKEAKYLPIPEFNPASSVQKRLLFEWLGIESDKLSKDTGLPSYNRDVIEEINAMTEDLNIKDLTQAFIDHSFSAIVKNNFINAFYKYTINNRLYGNIKNFGAKSYRPTSSDPK